MAGRSWSTNRRDVLARRFVVQSLLMDSPSRLVSPPIADDSAELLEPLHPNARLNWILSAVIGSGILVLVGCVAEILFTRGARHWPWPFWLPVISLASGAVLVIASIGLAVLRFRRFGYRLREKDLIVQSGLIWRTRRCVPRARIQHVDIDSGPIDRALGLVEVKLYVAGGIGAVAELPGLSPEAAEQLKEALIVARTDGV